MILRIKIIGVFVVIAILLVGMAIFVYLKGIPKPCQEDWACAPWSECINDIETRTCTDKNNCGTTKNKPIEIDSCGKYPPGVVCGNNIVESGELCDPPVSVNPNNQCQQCSPDCKSWVSKTPGTTCTSTPYCSGTNRCGDSAGDKRQYDFHCDGSGNCVAQSSEICACRASDSDGGINYTTPGTCTQYNGCSGGNCISNPYNDTCIDATRVNEYYVSGTGDSATCANTSYDCTNLGPGYTCSGGGCVPPGCSCGVWSNAGCGQNPCSSIQMKQNRVCTPAGCAVESQCVGPIYGSWLNQGCGISCGSGGTCAVAQQCQKRTDSYGCALDQYQCVADTNCEIPLLQNETGHIDNSLEYLRARGLGVHDIANYVISKSYLKTQIPNKTQIINYFDSKQGADGSWSGVRTPMFTTHRVLLAYYIMGATPKKSLDVFFSNYDTWEEALTYDKSIHGSFDGRDIYHIVFGWSLYYRQYPPWLNNFFAEVEKEPYVTSWTTSTNSHKRTHMLYSYVIARRQFPNLDEIINETLREQSADGHWDYQCLSTPRPVYCNAIQLILLQQIIKLYPTYRTTEIQNSIDKSRQWVYDTYNMTTVNGTVMGYFGTAINIEDSLMTGIMAAGINGLMDINVDMTFSDLVSRISQ